jgi:hypothetical protein
MDTTGMRGPAIGRQIATVQPMTGWKWMGAAAAGLLGSVPSAVYVLVAAAMTLFATDFVTGVWLAWTEGKVRSSTMTRKTVNKLAAFFTIAAMGASVSLVTYAATGAVTLLTWTPFSFAIGLICMIEGTSNVENLHRLEAVHGGVDLGRLKPLIDTLARGLDVSRMYTPPVDQAAPVKQDGEKP